MMATLQLQVGGDTSTKQGAEELLKWNEMKALSHMLAMEEHLQDLSPEEAIHSWCLLKHHLLATQHHLSEAVGHAERAGYDSTPYRLFRQKLLDLNVYPEPHISINDVVKLRTEWRVIISDPTLTAECPLCEEDVSPEVLKLMDELKAKYHFKDGSLSEIEDEMADRMLTFLSQKHGVPKPNLFINPFCHTPSGLHIEMKEADTDRERPDFDKVILCRGGVNALTLSHEFGHYLDHVKNMPVTEPSAEKFALQEVAHSSESENALNRKTYNHSNGEKRMVTYMEIGVVYGAEHIAKGAERSFEEVDKYAGVSALKPHQRWSTWLNMGFGFGLPIITYLARKRIKTPWDLLLIAAGGHMSTKVWDYAEEYATPVVAATVPPRYVPTPSAPARVVPTPSVPSAGRYVIIEG